MNFGGDHPAHGHGEISPRCVPEGASDKKNTSSWQYIAAMYSDSATFGKICVLCIQKAPQSAVGEYAARTSCHQGAFSPPEALKSCTAHKSCHPLMDLALAQGCLPPPSAPPIPATCQCLPLAAPITVRDKPPMNFGGDHSAHGLQFGQAPRDRRLHHLDGQADNGMLCRTGPEFQNREQVGAEPPAEAAGPAGPAAALPKTPIERTNPS